MFQGPGDLRSAEVLEPQPGTSSAPDTVPRGRGVRGRPRGGRGRGRTRGRGRGAQGGRGGRVWRGRRTHREAFLMSSDEEQEATEMQRSRDQEEVVSHIFKFKSPWLSLISKCVCFRACEM